ncbi:MAG: putative phospholipase D family protein, partial [uncultured Rubrobacteraceae bacterium]
GAGQTHFVPRPRVERGPSGPGAGPRQRRAAQGGQPARVAQERVAHLRRLARGDLQGRAVGPPRQLHHQVRRHRPQVRRGARREGGRGCPRPGAPRLVRLPRRAALVLGRPARGGRGGQGGQPSHLGGATRGDQARPPEAPGRGRGVRLNGRGVHRRWLARCLPRDRVALPGHGRQREGSGRGRHRPGLRRPVGRDRRSVAGRRAPGRRRHTGRRRTDCAGGDTGAAQDADPTHAGAAHRGRAGEALDHRRILPLHAHPHAGLDGHGPRRRGRTRARAGDQRHPLDRGGLARRLPAVPGGGGPHLRVRGAYDPRQDPRRGRMVLQGGLDESQLRQPRLQLGDRPRLRGPRLRRADGKAIRGRPVQREGDPPSEHPAGRQGRAVRPDRRLQPRRAARGCGERLRVRADAGQGGERGPPEGRRTAGGPRASAGRGGQRRPARRLTVRDALPSPRRLAADGNGRLLRRVGAGTRGPLGLPRRLDAARVRAARVRTDDDRL